MNRKLSIVIIAIILLVLAACATAPVEPNMAGPTPNETMETMETMETKETAVPAPNILREEAEAQHNAISENEEATTPETFTLHQIEEALKPQLDFAGERSVDWEVVSATKVGINPAGTMEWLEPAGTHVDIGGSVRYEVKIKWADEPNYPEAEYVWDHEAMSKQADQYFLDNPDADLSDVDLYGEGGPWEIILVRNPILGTTEVSRWDFFIVDGNPELVFVVC